MKIKAHGFNAVFDEKAAVTKIISGNQTEVQDKLSNFARGFAAVDIDVIER